MATTSLDKLEALCHRINTFVRRRMETHTSPWIFKLAFFGKMRGDDYSSSKRDRRRFWQDVKLLIGKRFVFAFTSKNTAGERVCFRNGLVTKKFCLGCRTGKRRRCTVCKRVIRFCTETRLRSFTTKEVPPSFRGVHFTQCILPQVLSLSDNQKNLADAQQQYGTDAMRTILHQSAPRDPLSMVEQLLECVYGQRRHSNTDLWIAPTQVDNAATSLHGMVELNDENSIRGLDCKPGRYHVWGFNEKAVCKWYTLQKGDIALFGSVKTGLFLMAFVRSKFIWKPHCSKRVFSFHTTEAGWTYGFTIDNLLKINITQDQYRNLCHDKPFQTQTKITNENDYESWVEALQGQRA